MSTEITVDPQTGNLALSRAIGDFNFKENTDLSPEEQIITATPEIVVVDVTSQHEFIVLACDGEPVCTVLTKCRAFLIRL